MSKVKQPANFAVLWACLISLAMSACTSSGAGSLPTPSVTPRPQTRETIQVPTAVPTATSTPTPSPTVLPTPLATLSKPEAYSLLAELLEGNSGCQLPCWWGLIPGQASAQDVESAFLRFGAIAEAMFLERSGGDVYLSYPTNDKFIDVNLSYRSHEPDQTAVQMIKVFTQTRREVGNTNREGLHGAVEYEDLLGSYSVDNMLSKYGPPGEVLVRADIVDASYTVSPANDISPETFEVTLLYPARGIFVRYNMLAERVADKIRGCPTKAFVELWLLSPDEKDSYDKTLSSMDMTWEGNWPYSKPVQEVTDMSLDEFYQTFSNPTDQCIETPPSIWPGH